MSEPKIRDKPKAARAFVLMLIFAVLGVALVAAIAGIATDHYGPRGPVWQPVFSDLDQPAALRPMDDIGKSNRNGQSNMSTGSGAAAEKSSRSEDPVGTQPLGQQGPGNEVAVSIAVDAHASPPATPDAAIGEAKRLIEFVVSTFPEMPDALELCARIRLWLGDSDGAVDAWQECLDRWPQYAYAHHGMGTVAAGKGESARAVQLFRKAIELEPELIEAQRELARALLDDGKAEQAVSVLKDYITHNPQRADGYVSLGFAYQQLGDSQQAKQSYEAAIQRDPKHTRAVYGLATACARLGLMEESQVNSTRFREMLAAEGEVRRDERSNYDDVAALCENLGGFYTDVGRICFSQGQLPVAEMLCRRAATVCPELSECRQALALICRRQGRLAEAIHWLEELGRCVDDPDIYYVEIGRLHLEMGESNSAEAAFRHARRLAPKNTDACTSLAHLLLNRGDGLDEAVALAEAAIAVRPSAENYALLGTARQSVGDRSGSIDALQRAVELAPEADEFKRALETVTQQ